MTLFSSGLNHIYSGVKWQFQNIICSYERVGHCSVTGAGLTMNFLLINKIQIQTLCTCCGLLSEVILKMLIILI